MKTKLHLIVIIVLSLVWLILSADGDVALSAWQPPIGIPRPEFGIEESYRMYDNPANRNPNLTYHQDQEGGYYTHYIDNTHLNATDSDNPYGTAERPRVSFPEQSTIVPGSVIEMHGGPYSFGWYSLKSSGTQTQPIFWRGPSGASVDEMPLINSGDIYISGHYIIIENINFGPNYENSAKIAVRPITVDEEAHHVSIRNCESGAGMIAVSYVDGAIAENVVFYNNHIHLYDMVPPDVSAEPDRCGVGIGGRSNKVWIVDNHIHHLSGDCVGAGHGARYTARNYYIGRNIMHDTSENAVDLKEVENIIVSENIMYNYAGGSSGQSYGAAMVLHYGPTYSPKNTWVLYNEIYNCNATGIQVGGDQEHPVYIIGNIIHDIRNGIVQAYMFESFDLGGEFIFSKLLDKGYVNQEGEVNPSFTGLDDEFKSWFPLDYDQFSYIEEVLNKTLNSQETATGYRSWNCRAVYMINNVFYNNDNGIRHNAIGSANPLILYNNIISKVSNDGYHLFPGGDTPNRAVAEISYNIFYQPQGQARIIWGGTTYNLSQFQQNTGKGEGCLDADPLFVDPDNNNFSLQLGSPAIDAGIEHSIYQLFQDTFGLDIRVDYEGRTRPQGSGWDIGAYEYTLLPVAVIQNEPKQGYTPLNVSFDGSQSKSPHGDMVSYEWDFGDGSTSTKIKTSHIFTSAGEYTVTLTVTDELGLKGKSQTRIIVFEKEFGELPPGCYNNVFNPTKGEKALIVVELPKQSHIGLNLYNTRGNKIRELVDEEKEADVYKYYWDGKDDSGNVVGSGLYFVHIQAGDYKKTKKIVVIK